jgi:hypothetical protein
MGGVVISGGGVRYCSSSLFISRYLASDQLGEFVRVL